MQYCLPFSFCDFWLIYSELWFIVCVERVTFAEISLRRIFYELSNVLDWSENIAEFVCVENYSLPFISLIEKYCSMDMENSHKKFYEIDTMFSNKLILITYCDFICNNLLEFSEQHNNSENFTLYEALDIIEWVRLTSASLYYWNHKILTQLS